MVRGLLNGRFENTAFCVFDPLGQRRLSRTGRSPDQGLSARRGPGRETSSQTVIGKLNQIAADYIPIGATDQVLLQDFNTFRQALNVASADQRLLLQVNVDKESRPEIEKTLMQVFADQEIVGKFHLNFLDPKTDENWGKAIQGANDKPSLVIIQAGQFGLDGTLVQQLTLESSSDTIKSALLAANKTFAESEKRKSYSSHVQQGRRQRIYFENEIPYGEDKDGDGKVDRKGRKKRQR